MLEKNIIFNKIKDFQNASKILRGIFDYSKKKTRLLEIHSELLLPETWKKKKSIKKLNQEQSSLKKTIKGIHKIEKNIHEAIIFLELAIETEDNIILSDTIKEIKKNRTRN